MTTEIAKIENDDGVLDAEAVEPLSLRDARALDKKIRSCSDKVTNNFNTLLELLGQAFEGQIHVALGLPSWTAYVKDAADIQVDDRYERKELAKLMSGKGMSQRAIAGALGYSQKTIDRDLEDEVVEGDTVETLDGKTAPRHKEKPAPEPAKQASVAEDFRNEVYQLQNDLEAFKEILEDERFAKARVRLGKSAAFKEYIECLDGLEDVRAVITGEMEAEAEEAEEDSGE
jgi:transcriptional regulator with XRE-family HTH domain